MQRPLLPPFADVSEDQRLIGSTSFPADHASPRRSPPPSSPAATAITLSPASSVQEESPVNERGHPGRPLLHRTTSVPVTPVPSSEGTLPKQPPSQSSTDPWIINGISPTMEHPLPAGAPRVDPKTEHQVEPCPLAPLTDDPVVPTAHKVQALRKQFGSPSSHVPVRRAKSEGHVRAVAAGQCQSTTPAVCTDATMNDRLWSKLEPGSHRDSVSSSSSISSNDTVIDLSLPNLARKSLTCLNSVGGGGHPGNGAEPPWVSRPRSAIVSYDAPGVSKSKSNPNLRQVDLEEEIQPRPLGASRETPPMDSPNRLTQRRHTWSRLYMEGLKQASSSTSPAKRSSVATAAAGSSLDSGSPMSKSLGDLTSDDIVCNFESKYRSISRSFVVRPSRDQLRKGGLQKGRAPSDLTEQLRRLTDVEPLTACDFAPQTRRQEAEEEEEEAPMRRMSSRSQSRVRYVANRAKQAQERQRLQGLAHARNGNISGSPIEERGNPEGACCIARSPCASLDLLSQLTPPGAPARQSQNSPNPDSNEVFFMLKL